MEKPEHYSKYDVDALDVSEAMGDLPAFCRTCVLKYIMRYQHKDKEVGLQDLYKAQQYVSYLIREQEKLLKQKDTLDLVRMAFKPGQVHTDEEILEHLRSEGLV